MTDDTAYASRHKSDPDPHDPGFCRCGLGLDAWVHTDTKRYRETPLSQWWGSSETGGNAPEETTR